jgi:acetolactate synthase regulatory subunit
MKERIYAEVSNGTESLLRAVSLLRRKEFDVVNLDLRRRNNSEFSDLYITVEKSSPKNPFYASELLSKLVDFNNIQALGGDQYEAIVL